MITGQITSAREAIVSLGLFSAVGQLSELAAVLDTGFTAYLTLSPA